MSILRFLQALQFTKRFVFPKRKLFWVDILLPKDSIITKHIENIAGVQFKDYLHVLFKLPTWIGIMQRSISDWKIDVMQCSVSQIDA